MSIGEVLSLLRPDFPEISISKIRFLEAEGLIEPERTPSGYRKFSHQDVERLRYVLTSQREHYLPLKVIKEHLDALDRGLQPPALNDAGPQVPRVVLSGDGYPAPEAFATDSTELRLSRRELISAAEIDEQLLEQLETYGLVTRRQGQGSAPYDGDALVIAKTAGELAGFGIEPRHLRSFKTAADREVGLVEQVVTPMRQSREAGARARSEEAIKTMAALSVRLHATLVKAGLHSRR